MQNQKAEEPTVISANIDPEVSVPAGISSDYKTPVNEGKSEE